MGLKGAIERLTAKKAKSEVVKTGAKRAVENVQILVTAGYYHSRPLMQNTLSSNQ